MRNIEIICDDQFTKELLSSHLKQFFEITGETKKKEKNSSAVLMCLMKTEDLIKLKDFRKSHDRELIICILPRKTPLFQEDPVEIGADLIFYEPVDFEEMSKKLSFVFASFDLNIPYRPKRFDALNSLIDESVKEARKNEEFSIELLSKLYNIASIRDNDTYDHAQRVGELSRFIAEQSEMDAQKIFEIRMAAPLHDIGKIGIPDAILFKNGSFTDDEWKVMRTHTQIGAEILKSQNPILQCAERIALYHHEKYDGSGYLKGLKGEEIPVEARIVSIADAFDEMISKRPYKDERTFQESLGELMDKAGTQFDPQYVDKFVIIADKIERLYTEVKKNSK